MPPVCDWWFLTNRKDKMGNAGKNIRIEKVTINVGAGKNTDRLEKSIKLIESLAGMPPVKTYSKKRIPTWGLRPGLPIGCKLTLRKEKAKEMLKRLLRAKENKLMPEQFDNRGNVAFGIHEYIDIPDARYDPDIGILGFQVCVTLERPGFRVKKRRIRRGDIHKNHEIKKGEAIEFLKKEFDVNVGEAE